ncbi:MAG: hypothetical protein KJ624_06035 [Chloroflexi bacterium]|nr:hypothetical protein [Chloroflexota bacterium]
MARDTVTLALTGDVRLGDFADAIGHLRALVESLSKEFRTSDEIVWIVHDLQVGSAIATVRGEAEQLEKVERVVDAYGSVGKALERNERPDFSESVLREAYALATMLSDRLPSIRFETPDTDATIVERPSAIPTARTQVSLGSIEGRVETLTKRKGLRFTLYDVLNDRAISCYLQEGREELMRHVWGKSAIVEGEISREVGTGRPVAIRRITNIVVLPEAEPGSYLKARGASPMRSGSALPEEIIRRLRDA